jgi:hypothetical protein
VTYEKAVDNQWNMAYHRIAVSRENAKDGRPGQCKCAECKEHMEAIARGPEGQ